MLNSRLGHAGRVRGSLLATQAKVPTRASSVRAQLQSSAFSQEKQSAAAVMGNAGASAHGRHVLLPPAAPHRRHAAAAVRADPHTCPTPHTCVSCLPGAAEQGPEDVEALALASQVALLAAAVMLGRWAARRGWAWISEAGIALLLGLGVGMALVALHASTGHYARLINFRKDFFFLAILPPIMFEAGFR